MTQQPAARAVTTMASPMIVPKDAPFADKLAFAVVALVIGIACFVALLALLSVVMPRTADRCKAAVARWPVQALLVGLLAWGIGGSAAWFFLARGYVPRLLRVEIVPGMLAAGLTLVTALLALTAVGATGVVRFIGDRLTSVPDRAIAPIKPIVVGTLAAVLAAFFPIVGWVVVLPGLLFVAPGALLLAWIRRVPHDRP